MTTIYIISDLQRDLEERAKICKVANPDARIVEILSANPTFIRRLEGRKLFAGDKLWVGSWPTEFRFWLNRTLLIFGRRLVTGDGYEFEVIE